MLTKLDSVEKKTDQVWSGVQTLTERAGEEATTREQWHENPLGSGQAVADYLLTMDSMRIERGIAVALVRFGYGASRKQCAEDAGVSESTIKRALKMARQTPYAKFFARTRLQKRKALAAMKKPDEKFAVLRQLAEKDPDKLRAWIEQMILKAQAQGESDKGSAWDQTVDGLS
jgi:AraC-like DNA-binding protein